MILVLRGVEGFRFRTLCLGLRVEGLAAGVDSRDDACVFLLYILYAQYLCSLPHSQAGSKDSLSRPETLYCHCRDSQRHCKGSLRSFK